MEEQTRIAIKNQTTAQDVLNRNIIYIFISIVTIYKTFINTFVQIIISGKIYNQYYIFIQYISVCRRTEFLRVRIPVLKSPNGHLGSSDADLGRKTERSLFTLGSFIYTCAYYKL